jgi:hypothetical protein
MAATALEQQLKKTIRAICHEIPAAELRGKSETDLKNELFVVLAHDLLPRNVVCHKEW